MQDTTAGKVVSEVLDALSAKFGTTAERLWDVMVHQQYVWGIAAAFLAIGFWAFAFVVGRVTLRNRRAEMTLRGDGTVYDETGYIFAFIGVGALALIGVPFAYEAVTGFINPQYGAIQDVLSAITPK